MSERLTKRTENGGVKFSNGEYWNTVYPQNENCLTDIHRMAIKLCDLEDKIEQGKILELPCAVGSTIYRIDTRSVQCSHENSHYDEYWCGGCPHLEIGDCDARRVPYIFVIKNADAQAILGNKHLFATRAFLDRASAEAKLREMEGANND